MPKRPRDVSQRAKLIVDIATGEVEDVAPDKGKNKAAAELGRRGGKARARRLTAAQRSKIAATAAKSRWADRDKAETAPPGKKEPHE